MRTDGARGGWFETADGRGGRYEPEPVTSDGGDAHGGGDSSAAGLTFALGRATPRPTRSRSPLGAAPRA
ncbi:MAG: hypothetical protein U0V56_13415 [Actinomycetota bacterium]